MSYIKRQAEDICVLWHEGYTAFEIHEKLKCPIMDIFDAVDVFYEVMYGEL